MLTLATEGAVQSVAFIAATPISIVGHGIPLFKRILFKDALKIIILQAHILIILGEVFRCLLQDLEIQ
tara:strand:+ start:76 stop:279 length:204 start_codon:yes stop_codon:yes gene_type:complete